MKQQLRALAAAALLTVTLGTLNASAVGPVRDRRDDVWTGYPGSMCQPVFREDANRVSYYDGWVHNTSTVDYLNLECPIIRRKGGMINHGMVAVISNQDRGSGVTCNIRSFQAPNGALLEVLDPETFPYIVAGESLFRGYVVQHRMFDNVSDPEPGYYAIYCRVPPVTSYGESGIVFYEVEED